MILGFEIAVSPPPTADRVKKKLRVNLVNLADRVKKRLRVNLVH